MKKFFAILMLATAFMFSATAPAEAYSVEDEIAEIERITSGARERITSGERSSYGADVPDFGQFGSGYLSFTGRENSSNKRGNYVIYGYDCSVDLNENFAEQYMNYLVQNYPFQFIRHEYKEYRTSATVRDHWYFRYTGSKNVRTFDALKPGSATSFVPCHLEVSRSKNFQTGVTHFAIFIVNGLTYGG